MKLPMYLSVGDIEAVCRFLFNRPAGVETRVAASVFGTGTTSERKLSSCRQLGFVQNHGQGRVKLTRRGSRVTMSAAEHKTRSLLGAISGIPAYMAVIERAVSRERFSVESSHIVSFWLERFPSVVASETTQASQTVCFLRLMEGAGLGRMTAGTRGLSASFDFDPVNSRAFVEKGSREPADAQDEDAVEPDATATAKAAAQVAVDPGGESRREPPATGTPGDAGSPGSEPEAAATGRKTVLRESETGEGDSVAAKGEDAGKSPETRAPGEAVAQEADIEAPRDKVPGTARIFISDGGNERILDQIRLLAAFGKLETVAARSHESPETAMNAMRSCRAAVIHAGEERVLHDENGREVRLANETALIELGAAMVFCGRNIILLAGSGIELPGGLPDVRVCRYGGGELDGASILTLVKVLNELDIN